MIGLVVIVRGLAWIVAVHGELFGCARDAVIMKDGVDQGRRTVGVAVEQRLYRGRGGVEQRRNGRRFVVNDLRRRAHRRAVPDLMNLRRGRRRGHGRRAGGALIAEQLIRRGLVVGALVVVEDVLTMIAAVLVVVQRLGLARVHLRERRLRLIMLRITGRMLEGSACGRGGRLARPGRRRAARRAGRAGSGRGRSRLMILHRFPKVVLVLAVLVQAARRSMKETNVSRVDRLRGSDVVFNVFNAILRLHCGVFTVLFYYSLIVTTAFAKYEAVICEV